MNGVLKTTLTVAQSAFNAGDVQNTAQWALEVYNMVDCTYYPPNDFLSMTDIVLKVTKQNIKKQNKAKQNKTKQSKYIINIDVGQWSAGCQSIIQRSQHQREWMQCSRFHLRRSRHRVILLHLLLSHHHLAGKNRLPFTFLFFLYIILLVLFIYLLFSNIISVNRSRHRKPHSYCCSWIGYLWYVSVISYYNTKEYEEEEGEEKSERRRGGEEITREINSFCFIFSYSPISGGAVATATASSAIACASACDNNAQCVAWSWDSQGKSACYLKNSVTARPSNSARVSGVKQGQVGFDRVGNDLSGTREDGRVGEKKRRRGEERRMGEESREGWKTTQKNRSLHLLLFFHLSFFYFYYLS